MPSSAMEACEELRKALQIAQQSVKENNMKWKVERALGPIHLEEQLNGLQTRGYTIFQILVVSLTDKGTAKPDTGFEIVCFSK